jgi:hypothetical protein
VGLQATVSDQARAELEARLAAVANRDLTRRSEYQPLVNPEFEAIPAAGPLAGWQVLGDRATMSAELDATTPHGGATSLYLASRGARAAVTSEPFPTPATGQLFLTAWLRGENIADGSAVRLVLETDGAGQSHRKFADTQQSHPVSDEWKFYGFSVNDLPLDSSSKTRVKFEVEGAGEVWVDDVKLYDLLFPEKSYEHSDSEKLKLAIMQRAAENANQDGRITDCVRILDSYWPRFLLEYTSPEETPIVARQATAPAVPTEAKQTDTPPPAESPSLLKRVWPGNWF